MLVLQLLPAMGLGDDVMKSHMMESMPIIEQINKEFRDPVSYHTHARTHTHAHTHTHTHSPCGDIIYAGEVDICVCMYSRVPISL